METLSTLLERLTGWIEELIPILATLAVAVFFWGLVKFIWKAGDERAHEEGKNVMIWGMIALFVLFALWSIVGFLQRNIFGVTTGGVVTEGPSVPTKVPMP